LLRRDGRVVGTASVAVWPLRAIRQAAHTRRVKFGILFRPQDPPQGERLFERWQQILAAAEVAEASGFDGVFLPEHHMMEDGYPPSPWAALGAIAARTSRLELGTAVYLLPLGHPIRTAEAAAMLDVISAGRVRLGVGLGNYEPEYELYGLDKRKQVSRFEESIELLLQAWRGDEIDHEGQHFRVKGRIAPRPLGAELWIGATSEPGVRRAAKYGCTWLAPPLQRRELIGEWSRLYRESGQAFGTRERLGVALLRDGWVGDSLADVERTWWPYVRREHWFYFSKLPRFMGERETTFAGIESEEQMDFEQHRHDRLIVGSPQDCIEQIEQFRQTIDPSYLIMTFRLAAGPSFDEELECLRRFGAEVIPAFA
jgi:alkanesulfonate monooxygenase SsuD/methylene tetrahydromethanopterin reductase-like flavin-dependent oxidoreductase (luciferase family)